MNLPADDPPSCCQVRVFPANDAAMLHIAGCIAQSEQMAKIYVLERQYNRCDCKMQGDSHSEGSKSMQGLSRLVFYDSISGSMHPRLTQSDQPSQIRHQAHKHSSNQNISSTSFLSVSGQRKSRCAKKVVQPWLYQLYCLQRPCQGVNE